MSKKETNVKDWIAAFLTGTSFWKNSVHVDELLGKGQKGERYYFDSFGLLADLIANANETGLIKSHYLCLSFSLKPSETLAVTQPNFSELWKDFSHTPPELYLIERATEGKRGTVEAYERPIPLKELDKSNLLAAWSQNIHAYYTCWRTNEADDEEYDRAVFVEYR